MRKRLLIPVVIGIGLCIILAVVILIANSGEKLVLRYSSFTNCLDSVKAVENNTYGNLDFSDCYYETVNITSAGEVNAIIAGMDSASSKKISLNENDARKKALLGLYEVLFGKECTIGKDDISEDGSVDLSTEAISCRLNPYNTLFMADNSRYVLPVAGLCSRRMLYRLDEEAAVPDICAKGVSMSLSEAVKWCDELNSEYLSAYCIGDSYSLKNAYIITAADGHEAYVIRYAHSYKGISMNDVGNGANSQYGTVKMNWLEYEIDVEGICGVRNFYSVAFMEEKKLDDSFLDFESACALLSNYLAPYGVYNVDRVSIEYVSPFYDDENHSETIFEYRPMWCFQTGNGTEDTSDIDPRMIMCVDMQTADIYVVDMLTNRAWFSINPDKPLDT